MATQAATKRLTKEYLSITRNPPPYITAHPSDSNILEWHYILTGPPQTPYEHGQYWGTLTFPPEYPFAPPAIRMHTPSGRFQPSTRLCLSISDFHPKSFNPAWEVATILIGLLSFMTSEEMTTGSVRAGAAERRALAARSRWWNSTGGGSWNGSVVGGGNGGGGVSGVTGNGAIKAGDGGKKFRTEWAEVDAENWQWMKGARIDVATGTVVPKPVSEAEAEARSGARSGRGAGVSSSSCAPADTATALFAGGRHRLPGGAYANSSAANGNGNGNGASASADARRGGRGGREGVGAGTGGGVASDIRSWLARNKYMIGVVLLFGYVLVARMMEVDGRLDGRAGGTTM